jgi:hypothetical protein
MTCSLVNIFHDKRRFIRCKPYMHIEVHASIIMFAGVRSTSIVHAEHRYVLSSKRNNTVIGKEDYCCTGYKFSYFIFIVLV